MAYSIDKSSNQDEICSITFDRNLDAALDENEYICQLEITTHSAEECGTNSVTIESLPLNQLNTENVHSIINDSDDEPLLSIHQIVNNRNNRKRCPQYWLEILFCSIILIFTFLIIFVGIVIYSTRDYKPFTQSTRSIWYITPISTRPRVPSISFEPPIFFTLFRSITPLTSSTKSPVKSITCSKQSSKGKSCSLKNSTTILLASLENLPSDKYCYFSFLYTALSKRSIITFSFGNNRDWYLDDISIYDTSNNVELIEDGGFESGTLYAYCVCDSTFARTKPKESIQHSGSYACYVDNFFLRLKLSQAVATRAGRNYNVSFWIQNKYQFENSVAVYMSAAFDTDEQFGPL